MKEAVAKAIEFAESILDPPRASGLRIEEIEAPKVNGEHSWSITLSMPSPGSLPSSGIFGKTPREYKTFTVNSQTGQVLSMKIRELVGSGDLGNRPFA